MTKLREICYADPAVAIKGMIDGLVKHQEIKDFKLDFNASGKWTNGICFGGAATVTLIQMLDLKFTPIDLDEEYSRSILMKTDLRDLRDFEEAMNLFSRGNLLAIEKYFNLPISGIDMPWNLQNSNWESEIPEVINFWEQLTGRRYEQSPKNIDERWEHAAANRLASDHQVAAGEHRFGRVGGLKG